MEQSHGFRNFLHNFTEILNTGNDPRQYSVPFHSGSFHDFNKVDYNRRIWVRDYDDDGDEIWLEKVEKYRHNIVLLSNFLTTKETVMNFAEPLYHTALNMRNRGILLVVGAKSTLPKYTEVYPELDKTLVQRSYTNSRFLGGCKKVCSITLSYSYNDRFGARIKKFLVSILDHFSSFGDMSNIPQKVIAATKSDYGYEPQWEMHAFHRYSRFIGRRPKRDKKT